MSKWQQVSLGLQDLPKYASSSKHYCELEVVSILLDFQL